MGEAVPCHVEGHICEELALPSLLLATQEMMLLYLLINIKSLKNTPQEKAMKIVRGIATSKLT